MQSNSTRFLALCFCGLESKYNCGRCLWFNFLFMPHTSFRKQWNLVICV
uniref:Alpha-dioxygenase 2 n=1 Tax=Rhizophora mucronata TaxID=61149 RepID=A0A2P2KGC3_RHIMU